ncbi:glutathione S-transferase family protein [Stenotrophobium rhamnosiphilum]|uniref:Glutathione S-transferase n=1 Tax=Stenotrophobium rhamnosiphilum TaxID=2029166 RepID=A0A2T5MHG5_9GAMM|nr:glutathione S-transferase N-terminal domain-containing protein [Stenotrophobium rhamnosiphilum]PTU32026.1 glutathione S-transferase [Stenotrophobium rhamnosiphilum]
MKMKLYGSKTSPFARKVRVVAVELGLSDLIEEILTDPFSPPPEFLAANPLSRIPTLVTEKGEALPDSELIIEYLQTRGHSGVQSLPRGTKRWAALRRARIADGITTAAVAMLFEKRRPESIIYTAFLDRQAEIILRSVGTLSLEVDALSLDTPSIVEISTAVALSYLDFRLPYIDWRKDHEALVAWHEKFSQRPSMIDTQPPAA